MQFFSFFQRLAESGFVNTPTHSRTNPLTEKLLTVTDDWLYFTELAEVAEPVDALGSGSSGE